MLIGQLSGEGSRAWFLLLACSPSGLSATNALEALDALAQAVFLAIAVDSVVGGAVVFAKTTPR